MRIATHHAILQAMCQCRAVNSHALSIYTLLIAKLYSKHCIQTYMLQWVWYPCMFCAVLKHVPTWTMLQIGIACYSEKCANLKRHTIVWPWYDKVCMGPFWNMFQKCTFFSMAHNANLKHISGWHVSEQHVTCVLCAYTMTSASWLNQAISSMTTQ